MDCTPSTPISISTSFNPLLAKEALVIDRLELFGFAVSTFMEAVTFVIRVVYLILACALGLPCVPSATPYWPAIALLTLDLLLNLLGLGGFWSKFLLCCHQFMWKCCTLPPVHHLAPSGSALVYLGLNLCVIQPSDLPRVPHVVSLVGGLQGHLQHIQIMLQTCLQLSCW